MVNNSTQWVEVRDNFVDIGGIVDHHSMSLGERWFDIGGIVDHHQYQQKSPLTSSHWVMVNNSTNIDKNHLSSSLIEWWSTIPPISTKITSHLKSFSDGKQFHQYQQKSPLTSTHWVMSIITPISTKITPHFNSLNDGQQFHSMSEDERWFLSILVELLTIIQWVEVRGDFCWYWCNYWHHSMSWCERWFLLILVELLTITEWLKVRGDFCWYWWNCWPSPISTKITSHHNSLSDCQQFHQYQQQSPLTTTH